MRHKALIVGAGRIGAGYNWPKHSFVYTHADTYLALQDKVELAGFVEPNIERARAASERYGVACFYRLEDALANLSPDIVSVCTQPADRGAVAEGLKQCGSVRGVWWEKPYGLDADEFADFPNIIHQVNYIRRFEPMHDTVRSVINGGTLGDVVAMVVTAKADIHTVCHFTDLARFWGVRRSRFHYVPIDTTWYTHTEYELIFEQAKMLFREGGAEMIFHTHLVDSDVFPGLRVPGTTGEVHKWTPKFMENALINLLDAMDWSGEPRASAAESVHSEKWADEIVKKAQATGSDKGRRVRGHRVG